MSQRLRWKRWFSIGLWCFGVMLVLTLWLGRSWGTTTRHHLMVQGLQRQYWLHVPTNLAPNRLVPLVLVFHGGGGQGLETARLTKFNTLANQAGFLVAYPNGIDRHWNDGREQVRSHPNWNQVDDVAFMRRLLADIISHYPVDPQKIYATGISNGAFFSHYLAVHLSEQIAAIAPVVGGVAEPVYQRFNPTQPLSVFVLQGTEDPLVPYEGGWVANERGKVVGTDQAVQRWVTHNRCRPTPTITTWPDLDPQDGCTTELLTWTGGQQGTTVQLAKVKGGGHAWFGGRQYLPQRLIGRACRDFDTTRVIWDFFQRHSRKPYHQGW